MVTIGAVISALIALFTVGAWVVGAEVNGERPNVVQVFAPAILFAVMAWGMWNARYWAVLGFQAVMAILMVGAFLTLISATSLLGGVTPIVIVLAAPGPCSGSRSRPWPGSRCPIAHLPR